MKIEKHFFLMQSRKHHKEPVFGRSSLAMLNEISMKNDHIVSNITFTVPFFISVS
jgi:hypothetical protein